MTYGAVAVSTSPGASTPTSPGHCASIAPRPMSASTISMPRSVTVPVLTTRNPKSMIAPCWATVRRSAVFASVSAGAAAISTCAGASSVTVTSRGLAAVAVTVEVSTPASTSACVSA